MSSKKVFIDNGYPQGQEFCKQFLSCSEFKINTLKKFVSSSNKDTKNDIASKLAKALEENKISKTDLIRAYCQQPRIWLSFKQGNTIKIPKFESPELLLTEFGKEGWYGPIIDQESDRKWYVRVKRIEDFIRRGSGEATILDKRYIRWSVIAEINTNYIALFWDGFTFSQCISERIDNPAQFPFWHYIPQYFDELAQDCQAQWNEPNLHNLILHNMWNRYLGDKDHRWQHLRIRAEASGVALNAHSAEIAEIDVKGLQALAKHLAQSALDSLLRDLDNTLISPLGQLKLRDKIDDLENALLCTLIKEWGTKSYEFSLQKLNNNGDSSSSEYNNIKTHCYFGLKPESKTQDSLQHLKCYIGNGGSSSVLKFLLKELGL
jgi:hypothetical protein